MVLVDKKNSSKKMHYDTIDNQPNIPISSTNFQKSYLGIYRFILFFAINSDDFFKIALRKSISNESLKFLL
jgi:hypothetical protein